MRLQSGSPSRHRGMKVFIAVLCVCLIVPMGMATLAGSQAPDPIYVNLKASVEGPEPLNTFGFELIPAVDNPEGDPVAETISMLSRADGSIPVLNNLTYSAPGTYRYLLQQKSLPLPGIIFDAETYALETRVSVEEGRLEAALTAVDGDGNPIDVSSIRFVNQYDSGSASVIAGGTQLGDGKTHSSAYSLEAVGDAPLPASTETNGTAFGAFRFGTIVFTEPGEYAYLIRQTDSGSLPADSSVYTMEATVSADPQGALIASACMRDDLGETVPAIVFDNRTETAAPEISLAQSLNDGEYTTGSARRAERGHDSLPA